MDNLEYLCDYRNIKDREHLVYLLRKNIELLSVNAEILEEAGSNEDIGSLLSFLEQLNETY